MRPCFLFLFWYFCAITAFGQPARVMSLNIAAEKDAQRIARELRKGVAILPDVLLLQEVVRTEAAQDSVAEALAKILGYHVEFAAPKPGATNVGVAILSRWRLTDPVVRRVRRFYKIIKVRPRLALGVTAHAPAGPIRIWTTHLDARINVGERRAQLAPIVAEAASFNGPAIVGGDFNTVGAHWLLHSVPIPAGKAHTRAIASLMMEHGFKTPFPEDRPTFDMFGMQLDWVYMRGLDPGATGVEPLKFTDHHAVWTEFR